MSGISFLKVLQYIHAIYRIECGARYETQFKLERIYISTQLRLRPKFDLEISHVDCVSYTISMLVPINRIELDHDG